MLLVIGKLERVVGGVERLLLVGCRAERKLLKLSMMRKMKLKLLSMIRRGRSY